jgi:hypothetical protein
MQLTKATLSSIWPVAAGAAVLVGCFASVGWFTPAIYPDLAGYLNASKSATPWSEMRHPLYGAVVHALERVGVGQASIPALNLALHIGAIACLYAAALRFGLSVAAARALAFSALFAQALVIWGRAVLPEMPAVSLLLLALAALFASVRSRRFVPWAIMYGLVLGLAYILRPIMLPAVLVFPLLFLMLSRLALPHLQLRRSVVLLIAGLMPFLAQSSYRLAAVGDFSLVSFGGFGISGMTIQMLTPDVVERLPEAHRPFARELLQIKDGVVAAGNAAPLFRNSTGQRSYTTTTIDGFDVLARNYDELMWAPLTPLQRPDESWLAFNARMGAFNAAVLRALPERWLLWVAGATGRLVSRLTVYNVAFGLALVAFGPVAFWRILRGRPILRGGAGQDWTVLVLVVGAWVVSTTALSVMTVFPALRYTDTGGLILAALPLYGLMLALSRPAQSLPHSS